MCGNAAPTSKRLEQAADGRLQYRRAIAQLAGFSDHFVDCGVERDGALDELAAQGLRVRHLRPRQRQHAGESTCDLGCQISEGRRKAPLGAAEIGYGKNDAGTHDPEIERASW